MPLLNQDRMTKKYDTIKSYFPNVRELIKINIMFGSMLDPKFYLKDKLESSYITIIDKQSKVERAVHWAIILYGYIVPYILDKAFGDGIVTDLDELIDLNDNIIYNYALTEEPPISIIWDLYTQIQNKTYPDADMDFVVETTYQYQVNSKNKSNINNGVINFDFTQNDNKQKFTPAVIVDKPVIPKKKPVVKGFVAETHKSTPITINHSREEL